MCRIVKKRSRQHKIYHFCGFDAYLKITQKPLSLTHRMHIHKVYNIMLFKSIKNEGIRYCICHIEKRKKSNWWKYFNWIETHSHKTSLQATPTTLYVRAWARLPRLRSPKCIYCLLYRLLPHNNQIYRRRYIHQVGILILRSTVLFHFQNK